MGLLDIIKKCQVPNCILRYIMMNFLDLGSIETIMLTVKEMNVLDSHNRDFLTSAKRGYLYLCKTGKLNIIQWMYKHHDYEFLIDDVDSYKYEDIDELERNGLKIACVNGHLNLVKWLCKKFHPSICGSDDGRNNNYLRNILFIKACANGHIHVAKWLLEIGEGTRSGTRHSLDNINFYKHDSCNSLNNTPLVVASSNNFVDIVQWLLELDATNGYYRNIFKNILEKSLNDACINGHLDVSKLLWNYNKIEYDFIIFKKVCKEGHLSVAQWLHTICVDKEKLHKYICLNDDENDDKGVFEDDNGVFEDDNGVFELACTNGHWNVVQWLYTICDNNNNNNNGMENLSKYFHKKNNIFKCVCHHGHLDIAKWIFSFGYVTTEMIMDAFRNSCGSYKSNVGIVQWLYSLINFTDEDEKLECINAVLVDACKNRSLDIAKWLYSRLKNCKCNFSTLVHEDCFCVCKNNSEYSRLKNCVCKNNSEYSEYSEHNLADPAAKIRLEYAFIHCCEYGIWPVLSWLDSIGYIVNNYHASCAFVKACSNDHIDIANHIYSKFKNISISKAFIKSSANGHLDVIRWLVSIKKIDIPTLERAFIRSCFSGHLDVAKLLYSLHKFGQDIIEKAFFISFKENHISLVKWLYRHNNNNFDKNTVKKYIDKFRNGKQWKIVNWIKNFQKINIH